LANEPLRERQERWREEASFFDKTAAAIEVKPIDPLALRRYSGPLRRRFSMEYRFRLPGDLHGKTVLDVGCGDGSNSVLLARLGAHVTGIDISPKLIEIAGSRAEINQVVESCRFVCSPLETADLPAHSFDIIWGDAVLHHLIPELPVVMDRLAHFAKPGALMMFAEPVNFNQTLRRIRFMAPVKTDHTPDERPLEAGEIETIRRHLPDLRIRHFLLLGRLDRFTLRRCNYERSSWLRRAISNCSALVDWVALSIPGLCRLGGFAILYGHPGNRDLAAAPYLRSSAC
jgi:2-polyprenyl-3-methyl-5-hydroxy-6-metoxy-1,4-benzoquinol methylase